MNDLTPEELERLVARLRRFANDLGSTLVYESAAAIEALTRQATADASEIARLREALEYYAYEHIGPNDGPWVVNSNDFGHVARAAVAPLEG